MLAEIADSMSEDKKCKDEFRTFLYQKPGNNQILLASCQNDLGANPKRFPMDP